MKHIRWFPRGGVPKTLILAVVMGSVFFIHPVYAVSEATRAEVELQQVALFKNGLGFFVSEVVCPKKKASFTIIPAAAASHGTFWVAPPPTVKLESLIAKEVDLEKSVEAISIEELLRANIGRDVLLSFGDEGELTIKGIIRFFAQDREVPPPDPYAPGAGPVDERRYIMPQPLKATLIILETESGEAAINSQQVRRVQFLDGMPKKTFTSKSKSIQLDIQMAKAAGGEKLTLSYLAKGITWAPSYIVDITKPDKAVVSAKAAVINEVCDLDDVTIQLVTGFPHLQFADVVSPLAMKENLAQFLQALIRGQSERGRLDAMAGVMSQRAMYRPASEERAGITPSYGAAEAGKTSEDLFLYPVEKVNLAKGQTGYFPLFTESVAYKHIYQWKIPDYVNEDDRYYQQRREQEQPEEEVWHCLRMENTTKVPWTTAPAEIVKEGFILGQDTLNYTPSKGETTLRITQAVSVKAEQVELETERKRDAAQLYGHHYDLVTVEGKLSVTNFQTKAITLEISKTLSGEVKSSQPEAKIESLARGLSRMNAIRKLTWTIELEPGESKQLGYVYEVYVRR
jgi:hypothetical protein